MNHAYVGRENKAKQSQSAIGEQVSENRGLPASSGIEDGGRKIDDRRRMTACPA